MLIWKLFGTYFALALVAALTGLMTHERLALTGRELFLSFFFLVIGAMIGALWL